MRIYFLSICSLCLSFSLPAQQFRQTQTDSYTRYELLSPESQSFRIIYDVSATAAGSTKYFNTLRAGSDHIVDAVWDLASGKELKWEIVDGKKAKANGLSFAQDAGEYLMVNLARPVPEGGQARLRIDKTYQDVNSYYKTDGTLVFDRSLGIKRNSVVLPVGYEVVSVNYPSQVIQETDGRIKLSYMNDGPSGVPYKIVAKPTTNMTYIYPRRSNIWDKETNTVSIESSNKARVSYNVTERSFENRDIVYLLKQPETNSFFLYHDYTESRVSRSSYVNIVRTGSKVSNPSAIILDTGEQLKVEILHGEEIRRNKIRVENQSDSTEVVVIRFDPIKEGESKRLRISETYTDPDSYLLIDDQLIWDRSFGRNRNTVILPEGWMLTANSIPGVIDMTEDGKVRIRFVNGRPDNIDVFIKAIRR